MYPKSRGPPLPSSQAYAVRPQFSAVPAPSHPPPPPHSGTTSPHTPVSGCQSSSGPTPVVCGSPSSSSSTTSNVSLNIAGRYGQYQIAAPNVDQLVPIMNHIFEVERNADLQHMMWTFHQNMLMNQILSLPPVTFDDHTNLELSSHGLGTVMGLAPSDDTPSKSKRRRTSQYEPGPSSTVSGTQLDDAVRKHEYAGSSVFSTYYQNAKLPATIQSFYIAGDTILEIPHPLFPHLLVHPIVASFSCSTLEDHVTNPTDSDWSHVYTLMLNRISKDLYESPHRLKNALELNRIQEHQQRYIPNLQYFRKSGYNLETRVTPVSESFASFLQQQVSQMTEMTSHLRQLCTQLGCAICSHSSVADQFEDVSLITHNGQLLGVKVQMRVPQIEHVDLEVKSTYAFAHNCACLTAVEILREGIIRPSATQYPDWLYTSGFYCRAEICQDLSLQSYAQAQTLAFKKARKFSNFQDPFRPYCIYGKARSRQPQHLTIGSGGTYADHGGLQFYDCIHSQRDKRWSFRSHLCQIDGIAAFP